MSLPGAVLNVQCLACHLWRRRDRFPIGSRDWLVAWAKRIRLFRALAKQDRIQRKLRRGGATIAVTSAFSDAGGIVGKLENLTVGEHSFVGRAELALHAPITVGRCVCINDGVKILTASHDATDSAWGTVSHPIRIEDFAWIATNAIILPGVTIGRGAVVGAGAVVAKDVMPSAIVAGNPAKALKTTRIETLDYRPTEFIALFRAWKSSQTHNGTSSK